MRLNPTLFTLSVLLLLPLRTEAQFLAPSAGGTVLNNLFVDTGLPSQGDDGIAVRNIGFPFTYYGQSYSTLTVSINGFLSFNTADPESWPANFELPVRESFNGTGRPGALWNSPRIYGLWDDLDINRQGNSGGTITESATQKHYAVTYDVDSGGSAPIGPFSERQQVQIVLFGQAETLGGFHFLPGDIAMAYRTLNGPFDNSGVGIFPDGRPDFLHDEATATIGIHEGGGAAGRFATLPGLPVDGVIVNGQKSLVKRFSDNEQFYLFRFNGQNYVPSVQSAAPEPSALVLLLSGALPALGLLLRRRYR